MATFERPDFQELEPQDVREYWEHEAHEFTPWLANEIQSEDPSYLEDVLEVIERERERNASASTASTFWLASEEMVATSSLKINSPPPITITSGKQSRTRRVSMRTHRLDRPPVQ